MDPWTKYARPESDTAQGPWARYGAAQQRPEAPTRADTRRTARPQSGLPMATADDERMFANAGGGYERDGTPTVAPIPSGEIAPEPYDFALDNAAVQSRGADAMAQYRLEGGAMDPTRLFREPWLAGTPRYVEIPQPENPNEAPAFPGAIERGNGQYEIFDPVSSAFYPATEEQYAQYQRNLNQDREERLARREREANPQYQAEYQASLNAAENVPGDVSNLLAGQTLGGTGIVPYLTGAVNWLDPATDGIDRGLASQAGRDATRDVMERYARDNPGRTLAAQLIGGLATPGLKGTGEFISGGQGVGRLARAGAVGAGYGGLSGGINATGGIESRGDEALLGALVGAGAGAVGQAGIDRLARGATRAASPQRQLSREGVDLTLGQMLERTPVVGGMIRATEDRLAGLPLVGDVIQGARMRTLESANIAGVNRALSPIGETLPKGTKAGFEAIDAAQNALGSAYARVLSNANLQLDQPLYDGIARVTADAAADMGPQRAQQLGEILQARVFRNVDDANATISGDEFKRIESALGQQQRELTRSMDADQQALGRALGDIRQVFRDELARQNPMEAPRLQDINRGYANLVRMEEAAGAPGSLQRSGVATPAQIASAVRRTTGTRSQRARGSGLMSDFAQNVGQVIPSQVPDSGTAGRGALAALLATGGAVLKPEIAVPVIAAASPYTSAGQRLLNIIYRSTDNLEDRTGALEALGRLAQRDPALLPYYEAAVQAVMPDTQIQTPEQQQVPQ